MLDIAAELRRLIFRSRLGDLLLFTAALLTTVRVMTAVFGGRGAPWEAGPGWFADQVTPLADDLVAGRPVTTLDMRQYGPTVLLLVAPALRMTGVGPTVYGYIVFLCVAAAAVAFALAAWRFSEPTKRAWLTLSILWFNSAPLLASITARSIDVWQAAFITAALVMFARPRAPAPLTSVPLVAATLAKLLPGFLLVCVCLRSPRLAITAAATTAVLLALGTMAFGPLLGYAYPASILSTAGAASERLARHWENNSLVGLLMKLAAGFRVEPARTGEISGYVVATDWSEAARIVGVALSLSAATYLLFRIARSRAEQTPERRAFEFSYGVITMLLVSPQTAHEYMVMALPALTVLLYLWRAGIPVGWPRWLTGTAAAAAMLICVFVPVSAAAVAFRLDALWEISGNRALGTVAPIGLYDHFGLSGLGLVLAWIAFAALDRSWSVGGLAANRAAGSTAGR